MNAALFRRSTAVHRSSHRRFLLALACAASVTLASGCAILPWASHNTGPTGPATITGVVTNDRDDILADASVKLSGPSVRRSVTTDIAGRFTFERVPLGRYVVSAAAVGFKGAKQTIQVDNEAPVRVELKLKTWKRSATD
mgnify:CR=1 FL=1